jgi:hypothetical protein
MAQQIVSAYFGDEKSFRNITQSLINKIADGTLDITADETLIPVFDAAPQTKLEPKDEKLIREEAVRGGADAEVSAGLAVWQRRAAEGPNARPGLVW